MTKIDQELIQKMKNGHISTAEGFPIDANHMASIFLIGHVLYSQGKLLEARRIFEGVVVLDPGNPYVHAMLGSIYQKQQLYGLALRHYNSAIQIFPKDIESLVNRGEIFLRFGRFKEAASNLKEAIELDPQRKSPSANRARLLAVMAQDSLKLAREQGLTAALQNKPESDRI